MSSDQKQRLLAGVLTEYNRMSSSDIVTIHAQSDMLVLVLPRIDNQICWELSLPSRSRGGHYNLVQSLNIICERCYSPDSPMRQQLSWTEEEITIPFLQNFSRVIRLVGKFFLFFKTDYLNISF